MDTTAITHVTNSNVIIIYYKQLHLLVSNYRFTITQLLSITQLLIFLMRLKVLRLGKHVEKMGLLLRILFMLVQLYMYICQCYLIVLLHTVNYLKTL